MIALGYTAGAVLAVVLAAVLDLFVLRTRLLSTRLFWASEAILIFFQLVVNGLLTGLGIVSYDPRVFLGVRLAYAPIEDLGFGFGLITMTLSLWVGLGHRSGVRGEPERLPGTPEEPTGTPFVHRRRRRAPVPSASKERAWGNDRS